MNRNAYADLIMEKFSKRIKKGDLTVETEKKLNGSVVIRYRCGEIRYGHIISQLEMMMYGNNDDCLVDYIISNMADGMKKAGYDPSEYLEV